MPCPPYEFAVSPHAYPRGKFVLIGLILVLAEVGRVDALDRRSKKKKYHRTAGRILARRLHRPAWRIAHIVSATLVLYRKQGHFRDQTTAQSINR